MRAQESREGTAAWYRGSRSPYLALTWPSEGPASPEDELLVLTAHFTHQEASKGCKKSINILKYPRPAVLQVWFPGQHHPLRNASSRALVQTCRIRTSGVEPAIRFYKPSRQFWCRLTFGSHYPSQWKAINMEKSKNFTVNSSIPFYTLTASTR